MGCSVRAINICICMDSGDVNYVRSDINSHLAWFFRALKRQHGGDRVPLMLVITCHPWRWLHANIVAFASVRRSHNGNYERDTCVILAESKNLDSLKHSVRYVHSFCARWLFSKGDGFNLSADSGSEGATTLTFSSTKAFYRLRTIFVNFCVGLCWRLTKIEKKT